MVSNRITEGVGKRIVDALKQQPETETINIANNYEEDAFSDNNLSDGFSDLSNNDDSLYNQNISQNSFVSNAVNFDNNLSGIKGNFAQEADSNLEVPANVAVLKQLISQLPAGVSKQTGAQIIKQTMEALGISMKSVLQEAQHVQEGLNNSIKDCQATAIEYKKQIQMLDKQSQQLQRQYAALNDIISLFIQTSI